MKMDVVAGSKNDEFYTPVYAILPITKYVPTQKTIWCPFDTEESNFVKQFRGRGNHVIASHIAEGKDFFSYEPNESYDYIISNPPYSLKNEVFDRLFTLHRPFAMLVGIVGLFESKRRFDMFSQNDFEIMYFDKRIAFFKDFNDPKPSIHPPFSSVYITHKLLNKQIVFEQLHITKEKAISE